MHLRNRHESGKEDLLAALGSLRPDHVQLICDAIDQQVGISQGEPLPHLGKLARKFDPQRTANEPTLLTDQANATKSALQDLLSASMEVVVARGDLTRTSMTKDSVSALGERENTVKNVIRSLKELGVYVDGIHHCIGLTINPPRRAPHSEENQPLQHAVTALAASGRLSDPAIRYCRAAGRSMPSQQPSDSLSR